MNENKETSQIDFLAIGDTVIDAFIKLTDTDRIDIQGESGHENFKICIPFADKIPYEEVYVVNAVGNAANAAVSASRLGLKTALVSNVGDDQNGKDCLDSLMGDGVSTEFIKINEGVKTNYHYVLWHKTERTILIKHEKYSYVLPDIGEPKWIYFSSVSKTAFPFHDTVADYLEAHKDTKLAFQPGKNEISLGKEKLTKLYACTEIFFCNVEEARTILEMQDADILELSKAMAALGPKIVSISDGPNGAYLYEGGELWKIPLYPDIADPVDRTGAGDAFASTIVAGMALGMSPLEAFSFGPINSMSVVQEIGAQKGLLSREKIEEYRKNAPAEYKPVKV